VTAEAAQPPLQPLPIRPGPASGESTFSYVRRLAVANHLRPMHLRRYLTDPGLSGGFRLNWLAAAQRIVEGFASFGCGYGLGHLRFQKVGALAVC